MLLALMLSMAHGLLAPPPTARAVAATEPNDCAPTNQLIALQFTTGGPGSDALVDLPSMAGMTVTPPLSGAASMLGRQGDFTVNLPPRTLQFTFTVRRAAAGQSTTVPFTAVDSCGAWPTLVGGGPTAF